jgi:hypothetical protein
MNLPKHLQFEVFAGTIGEGAAREYLEFADIWHKLPDINETIKNPSKAPVPDPKDVSVIYATVGALASKVDRKNFANILEFGARLQKEFEVLLFQECLRYTKDDPKKSLLQTKEFVDWSVRHPDLLLPF